MSILFETSIDNEHSHTYHKDDWATSSWDGHRHKLLKAALGGATLITIDEANGHIHRAFGDDK